MSRSETWSQDYPTGTVAAGPNHGDAAALVRVLRIAAIAFSVSLASCASSPRAPHAPDSYFHPAVHHLLRPSLTSAPGGSSLTRIAPSILLGTRHQFRDYFDQRFEIDGRMFGVSAFLDGVSHRLEPIFLGDQSAITDDWALVRAPDLEPRAANWIYDPHAVVRRGSDLVLVGYPASHLRTHVDPDDVDLTALQPLVVRSRVVSKRDLPRGWGADLNWGSGEVILCLLPEVLGDLRGFSGGAAFAWDEDRSEWIIVGIVQSNWGELDERSEELRPSRLVIVIRPEIEHLLHH